MLDAALVLLLDPRYRLLVTLALLALLFAPTIVAYARRARPKARCGVLMANSLYLFDPLVGLILLVLAVRAPREADELGWTPWPEGVAWPENVGPPERS